MPKDERVETTERLSRKFTALSEKEKSFIAGYMARAEEEKQKAQGAELTAS